MHSLYMFQQNILKTKVFSITITKYFTKLTELQLYQDVLAFRYTCI